ncbi:MAG TPA: head GIN domain-containing protein [Usitatibacteraceae bacterium]|nr:head GIN domain-containing protein [Usitatibacteraceae bacterium]
MSRRALFAGLAALTLLPAPAAFALPGSSSIAASGKVVTESRAVRGYTGIGLSVPGTVVVRQGADESLTIEADDNLMPEIETVVERGSLRIRFRRSLNVTGKSTIRILVTGPAFGSLAVAGSGDIVSENLKSRSLDVSVAGSGNVKIARLEVDRLKVSIAGSGDFRAAGRADEVAANIAGSGNVEAGRLEARRASVSIAGSGNATLWARESLAASLLGSGDVRYHGDPAVTRSIAGSGSLKRLGPAP